MKFLSFFFVFNFSILISFQCKAQEEKLTPHYFHTQCFHANYPKVIVLPDSFNFKHLNQKALIIVNCKFDSTGIISKFTPFSIYINNKSTNKPLKEYQFWNKQGLNMSKKEAIKFAKWSKTVLPQLTCIKRSMTKCDTLISLSNNFMVLEYSLE